MSKWLASRKLCCVVNDGDLRTFTMETRNLNSQDKYSELNERKSFPSFNILLSSQIYYLKYLHLNAVSIDLLEIVALRFYYNFIIIYIIFIYIILLQ